MSNARYLADLLDADGDVISSALDNTTATPEGTVVKSTGESGGTKFLREDGDGTASWAEISGGATGAGGDKVFMENELTVTTDYTLSANKSAVSVGPVKINTGKSVTIPTGHTWVIL